MVLCVYNKTKKKLIPFQSASLIFTLVSFFLFISVMEISGMTSAEFLEAEKFMANSTLRRNSLPITSPLPTDAHAAL